MKQNNILRIMDITYSSSVDGIGFRDVLFVNYCPHRCEECHNPETWDKANGIDVTVDEVYEKSRSQGFGNEVKRRIMLGNFVLSSGYFDAYYNKAKLIQQRLKKEFDEAYEKCDIILMPTTLGEAFKIGEMSSPVQMYAEDIFTIPANIASLPAISVPFAKGQNNLPLGLQFLANRLEEDKIYAIASYFEKEFKMEDK